MVKLLYVGYSVPEMAACETTHACAIVNGMFVEMTSGMRGK